MLRTGLDEAITVAAARMAETIPDVDREVLLNVAAAAAAPLVAYGRSLPAVPARPNACASDVAVPRPRDHTTEDIASGRSSDTRIAARCLGLILGVWLAAIAAGLAAWLIITTVVAALP